MSITYSTYLKLNELLRMQRPLSDGPEHDEMLFIVMHQINELWFKQLLHEFKLAQLAFDNSHMPTVIRTLKRVLTILKTLVAQVDVLETMTPVAFSSFRDRLESSTSFQSAQFHEIEIVLGQRDRKALGRFTEGSQERDRLEAAMSRRSLYGSFLRFLVQCGYGVPQEALDLDEGLPHREVPGLHDILVDIYHKDPAAWNVCELLVDLDEGVQEWRYRQLKMVERTVGERAGTVGAFDLEYLRSMLLKPIFPDLWAIRSRL